MADLPKRARTFEQVESDVRTSHHGTPPAGTTNFVMRYQGGTFLAMHTRFQPRPENLATDSAEKELLMFFFVPVQLITKPLSVITNTRNVKTAGKYDINSPYFGKRLQIETRV